MSVIKILITNNSLRTNFLNLKKNLILQNVFLITRTCSTATKPVKTSEEHNNKIIDLVNKHQEKIIYSSYIESKKLKLGYKRNKAVEHKINLERQKIIRQIQSIDPIPLSLRFYDESIDTKHKQEVDEAVKIVDKKNIITHFPFDSSDKFKESHNKDNEHLKFTNDVSIKDEITGNMERYKLNEDTRNWMTDYENYEDDDIDNSNTEPWQLNYGTPDPNSVVSDVPCGGCGALLHCKVFTSLLRY